MSIDKSEFDVLIQKPVAVMNLGHSVLYKTGNGLIVLNSSDNHIYSVKDVKENHQAIKSLSENQKAYVLNVAGKYTNIEADVREFIAVGPHKNIIAAEAFVIHSLAQKLIANFYFKVNKPVVSSAFFTDIKRAEEWLLWRKGKDMSEKN
ncbi:MAG: DUF7793 family protein [Bacteroidia bacterium]